MCLNIYLLSSFLANRRVLPDTAGMLNVDQTVQQSQQIYDGRKVSPLSTSSGPKASRKTRKRLLFIESPPFNAKRVSSKNQSVSFTR